MIVIDANVLVVATADDGPDGDTVRSRLRRQTLTAPDLVDLEVVSIDAAYVALAEALAVPLLTADRRLVRARAALRRGVDRRPVNRRVDHRLATRCQQPHVRRC